MRCIKQSQNNVDFQVKRMLDDPKQVHWREENGCIMFQERLYVPRNKKLREDIIRTHHDTRTAGHPGHKGTRELITRNYF